MISLEQVKNFYPPLLRDNPAHLKYLVKEYLQLAMLDYLASTSYIRKLTFIGGTNLRLIKGIDRFSEDLDFDCKDFSEEEFNEMTNAVLDFLHRNGLQVELKEKSGSKLKPFRSNLYFPELLYELKLSGHREERFLIKIECQDQQVTYPPVMTNIKGCGFFFPFPVPSDGVMYSMKIAALLSRQKGRDFYDTMFLSGQTKPDYDFLAARCGINNEIELKEELHSRLSKINLAQKSKDFEHLLFNRSNSKRVLSFNEFVETI